MKLKENVDNLLSIINSPAFNSMIGPHKYGRSIADFLYYCDMLKISYNAGVIVTYSYEHGTITNDEVKRLLRIPKTQNVSISDYFKHNIVDDRSAIQEFFDINSDSAKDTQETYKLNSQGKSAAERLYKAFIKEQKKHN